MSHFLSSEDLGLFVHHCRRRWSRRPPTNPFAASALMDAHGSCITPFAFVGTLLFDSGASEEHLYFPGTMSHAGNASKSLVVLMKLAAMLRIVPAVQFIFDKLAALLRGKGATKCSPMSFSTKRPASPEARLFNMPVFYSRPATTRLQCRKRTKPDRES